MKTIPHLPLSRHAGFAIGPRLIGLVFAMCAATAIGCAAAPTAPKIIAPPPAPVPSSVAAPEIEVPQATLTPASDDVRRVAFAFVGAKGDAITARSSDAIRVDLVRAGYWIVDPNGPSDARIEIRVKHSTTPPSPLLGTQITKTDAVNSEVSLTVVAQQMKVEWLVARFDADDESSNGADELVERLTTSPRLAMFAKGAAAKKAVHDVTPGRVGSAPSPTVAETAASRDDAEWSESALRRCRNGRRADACDKLRDYLEKFPNGAHAANAKAELDLAAHRLARK